MDSAETRLWRSVILQAFTDACSKLPVPPSEKMPEDFVSGRKSKKSPEANWALFRTNRISKRNQQKIDRDRARAWLTKPSKDFDDVCANAVWDADFIRQKAKLLAARGWEQQSLSSLAMAA